MDPGSYDGQEVERTSTSDGRIDAIGGVPPGQAVRVENRCQRIRESISNAAETPIESAYDAHER